MARTRMSQKISKGLKAVEESREQEFAAADDLSGVDVTTVEPSEAGKVYELGPHRLACGDCRDGDLMGELFSGDRAQMVMADPPYGVEYTGGQMSKVRPDAYFDSLGDDYGKWLAEVLTRAHEFSDDKAALHLWHASRRIRDIITALDAANWEMRDILVWDKGSQATGSIAQYRPVYEPCVYGHKRGKSPRWSGLTTETTMLRYPRAPRNELHPAQRPVAMYVREIRNHTAPGDLVLECFGGSGTSILASEILGRRCYMTEIHPPYCDIIRARYERWKS